MEWNEFESMRTIMKRERYWTENELREIACCCLIALDCIHKRGCAHGVITFRVE